MHGRNGHNAFKVDYTSIFMKYFVYFYYVALSFIFSKLYDTSYIIKLLYLFYNARKIFL